MRVQGLRCAVKKTQPNPRADLKLYIPVVGVVVLLGQLMFLEKLLTDLYKHLIAGPEKSVSCLGTSCPGIVGDDRGWGTTYTPSKVVARRAVWKKLL